jgi:hypothetical protein
MFISDLDLTITPTYALYSQTVPDTELTVNEATAQGRYQIVLDFNDSEGLYVRDLGTIFSWPTTAGTILDVWQPSIIPLQDDVYDRLSYHFLMSSFAGIGWQHVREINLAFESTEDLTLLLTFDQWPDITLDIPNNAGSESKVKVVLPPNKWKLMEGFLSCPTTFKLWPSDVQFKIGQWGRNDSYRIVRALVG